VLVGKAEDERGHDWKRIKTKTMLGNARQRWLVFAFRTFDLEWRTSKINRLSTEFRDKTVET